MKDVIVLDPGDVSAVISLLAKGETKTSIITKGIGKNFSCQIPSIYLVLGLLSLPILTTVTRSAVSSTYNKNLQNMETLYGTREATELKILSHQDIGMPKYGHLQVQSDTNRKLSAAARLLQLRPMYTPGYDTSTVQGKITNTNLFETDSFIFKMIDPTSLSSVVAPPDNQSMILNLSDSIKNNDYCNSQLLVTAPGGVTHDITNKVHEDDTGADEDERTVETSTSTDDFIEAVCGVTEDSYKDFTDRMKSLFLSHKMPMILGRPDYTNKLCIPDTFLCHLAGKHKPRITVDIAKQRTGKSKKTDCKFSLTRTQRIGGHWSLTDPSKMKLRKYLTSEWKGHNHDAGVNKWAATYGDEHILPEEDMELIKAMTAHGLPIGVMKETLQAVQVHRGNVTASGTYQDLANMERKLKNNAELERLIWCTESEVVAFKKYRDIVTTDTTQGALHGMVYEDSATHEWFWLQFKSLLGAYPQVIMSDEDLQYWKAILTSRTSHTSIASERITEYESINMGYDGDEGSSNGNDNGVINLGESEINNNHFRLISLQELSRDLAEIIKTIYCVQSKISSKNTHYLVLLENGSHGSCSVFIGFGSTPFVERGTAMRELASGTPDSDPIRTPIRKTIRSPTRARFGSELESESDWAVR
ncbi:hypothetical protein BDR26DRAFT_940293 [Obelidium mucronatum]|nr:hypothetical protein BDR26DRAFT_940293 [Obelidium mucronatum]